MKQFARYCAALALLMCGLAAPASAQQSDKVAGPGETAIVHPSGPIAEQYIVVFNDDVQDVRGLANALARRNGIRLGTVYETAIKGFVGGMADSVAERLERDPNVAYVEQDHYAFALAQTVPTGYDRIESDLNSSMFGSPAIAIIDSGIDVDHPDLNVVYGNTCFTTFGPFFIAGCGNGNGDDDFGHGTHVAGTTAAINDSNGVVGVAESAPLYAIKVLNNTGSGTAGSVIAGIDLAAQLKDQVAVSNMSLGFGSHQQSVCDAITNLIDAGVVTVVAAGNSALSVNNNYSPADCPGVITVSALSDFDGVPGGGALPTCRTDEDDSFANFSNYGPDVDIMAPGVCIYSTVPGGYGTSSGTSMASPHVAGLAALYIDALGTRDVNEDGQVDGADVAKIKSDLIAAAIAQSDPDCGLSVFDDPDTQEPIAFANATMLGGDGSCGGAVQNAPPVVSISSPPDGSSFDEGKSVTFQGTASDTEDGDLTSAINWSSNLDGSLGNGSSVTTTLSVGTHSVTADVVDSGGKPGSESISVTVQSVANTPPTVMITGPVDDSHFDEGVEVTFTGTADDFDDGDLSADIEWSSSLDGAIGTGASVPFTLSVGTHTISAAATDLDPTAPKTGIDTITITIDPIGGSGSVDVFSVSYCGEGGRNSNKHLTSIVSVVDDLGSPLSNATVNATITKNGNQNQSGTATTDGAGEARFSWKNAGSGDFTTTVDSVNGDTSVDTPPNGVNWPSEADPCN